MKKPRVLPLILVLLFAACGKQGPPMPPVPVIPRETTDLEVLQRGPKIVLTWGYPAFTTTGMSLPGIERVLVLRFDEPHPVATDDSSEAPGFDAIPLITPTQFERAARVAGEITRKDLPGFVEGARILFTERPPIRGADGRAMRYTYAVITEGSRGRSALSNLVTIVPMDAPLPPSDLRARATAPSVDLTWSVPVKTVLGSSAVAVAGYNIYRLPPVGASDEPLSPVNTEPVKEPRFEDKPSFGAHRYAVTAVVRATGPRVESELPLVVEVDYKDLLPPSPPANLNALVEDDAVRLVWDAVSATDFAGYKVYRRQGGAKRIALTSSPIKETFFVDAAPVKGQEVIYIVTSLDDKGNESGPSRTGPVLVAE